MMSSQWASDLRPVRDNTPLVVRETSKNVFSRYQTTFQDRWYKSPKFILAYISNNMNLCIGHNGGFIRFWPPSLFCITCDLEHIPLHNVGDLLVPFQKRSAPVKF